MDDFTEEKCNCGKVWRGKLFSRPATGCDVCFPPPKETEILVTPSSHTFFNSEDWY